MTIKIGVHWGANGDGLTECLQANSTTVKLCDSFPDIRVPAGALVIGRVVKELGFRPFEGHPRQAAINYVQASLHDAIQRNPHIQAWEALNEPVWGWEDFDSQSRMLWYSEFLAQCAREIVWRGKKAVLGNWSTGCPPIYDLWYAAKSMLEVTQEFPGKVFIGRHTYGPPWRKSASGVLEPDTDNAFRYRNDLTYFWRMGFPDVRFILTECGMDNTGSEKTGFMHPWRGTRPANDYWKKIGVDFEYSNFDHYWKHWIEPFEREIRKDACVVGANLFTLGLGNWGEFQLPGKDLAQRMQSLSKELGDVQGGMVKMTTQIVNVPIPIPVNAQYNFNELAGVIIAAANDLNEFGHVGTYTRFGQSPPVTPPAPSGTWPRPDVISQQIINAIVLHGKMPYATIPTSILTEMVSSQATRNAPYASLKSKKPLEEWGLTPERLDQVIAAFKADGLF